MESRKLSPIDNHFWGVDMANEDAGVKSVQILLISSLLLRS